MVQHCPTNTTSTSNQRETCAGGPRREHLKAQVTQKGGRKLAAPKDPETEIGCQEPGDTPHRGQTHIQGFPTRRASDRPAEDVPASLGWLWLRHRGGHHGPVFHPLTSPEARKRRGRHSHGLGLGERVARDTEVEKARRVLARGCRTRHAGSRATAIAAKTASGRRQVRYRVKGRV